MNSKRKQIQFRNRQKMRKSFRVHITAFLLVFLMTAVFAGVYYFFYARHIRISYYFWGYVALYVLYFLVYAGCAQLYDTFELAISRISDLMYSAILSAVITDIITYLILILLDLGFPNPLPLLSCLGIQIIIGGAWAYFAHQWFFHRYPPRKTLIIWDKRRNFKALIDAYGLDMRYDVVRVGHIKDVLADQRGYLSGITTVFFCGVSSRDRNKVLKTCVYNDIDAFVLPRVGDLIMSSARRIHMFHLPMLVVERYNPDPEYLFFKRFFDIMLSLIALIITSPIFLVVSIAIKATDGGTVFYKQTRLTKNGREFDVIKFRSMRMDAEKDGVARLSTGDKDPRITPIGRVIRACRIDELPQLLNILKGDMSIVGPRPERPEIAAEYEKELPEFALRLQAKCGLTGYAQVYGKYNTTPYDKLLMDLMYISKPSLAEDFKICLATVKILFQKESTEGIEEGKVTA